MDGRFQPQGYGCIGERNSLLVVPPGETRLSLGYCAQCEPGVERCVFLPSTGCAKPVVRPEEQKQKEGKGHYVRSEKARRAMQERMAVMRAQGLCHNGVPLARICWNCSLLCQADGVGFVCAEAPVPRKEGTVKRDRRRPGKCPAFALRLVMEIGELEEVA